MECNLNLFVEKQTPTGWQFVPELKYAACNNFDLFGMLAGLRNLTGVCTNTGFSVITTPKGFPEDASAEVEEAYKSRLPDASTPSYLTLHELMSYPWEDLQTIRYGVVSAEVYEKWKQQKKLDTSASPDVYFDEISGSHLVTLPENLFLERQKQGLVPKIQYYVRCRWKISYAEAAQGFYPEFTDKLKKIGTDEKAVRIVFFFT